MSKPKGARKRKAEPTDEPVGADGVAETQPVSQAAGPDTADSASSEAAGPDVAEIAATATATAAVDGPAPVTLELDAGLEIKDVESAHRRLAAALSAASALTVDVSRIATIDTAGVQLLLALRRSAEREQRPLTFTGQSAALTHALGVLGLDRALEGTMR